ncbi:MULTISPECIES: rod shape-determining protein MreC [Apibacter]|uniref:rod shape-determining protein MreC n=1 Tax=Apibacter TaxID=1778601 RepID=UPI00136EB2CE|nr:MULTISPECIES: rod shape-determining protein MreC [Apibacter]MXO31725.1 rod shape-determining protein MreC [Apibacter sp. B2912]QYN51338.1 rod shape-determining protein MreC [Apibacter sp. ESL0404]
MSVLINFLSKNSRFLLFLFLQILALFFTFNRNVYHNSILEEKIISFTGYVDSKISYLTYYINLKKENERLIEENKEYRNKFLGKTGKIKPEFFAMLDSTKYKQKYYYTTADIISNSITRSNNYLIIDRGTDQGVSPEMGVVTSTGVVGMIINCTKNYSKVISILNRNTRINARLKSSKYYGTLLWQGEDPRIMHLSDIPKYVGVKIGDTIETDGKSKIYPEGILIGRVSSKSIDEETGNWNISIELFQDMGNIQKVYVVDKLDREEIKSLKDSIN